MRDWLQGFGYINLWEQLHRAEELLILFGSLETVVADAWHDELRLQGSNIDNRDALLTRLREAVTVLAERHQLYLRGSPTGGIPYPNRTAADEFAAREVLRHIRRAINEFRDERRRGLVRARNRLLRTITLTGWVGFSLVVLAIFMGAPVRGLMVAAAFYLVGSIVGLFNQLFLDASVETVTEDYGLGTARLLHTPLFSGLAALGGVLIIPMLSILITPSGERPDQLSERQALMMPSPADIFDLDKRPFSLVLAAIFGLSPTILISRLQQEAEQYKADFRSSGSPSRR